METHTYIKHFLEYIHKLKNAKESYGTKTIVVFEVVTKKGVFYELIIQNKEIVNKLGKNFDVDYCSYFPNFSELDWYLVCVDNKKLIKMINRFGVNCVVLEKDTVNEKLIKPKFRLNRLLNKSLFLS